MAKTTRRSRKLSSPSSSTAHNDSKAALTRRKQRIANLIGGISLFILSFSVTNIVLWKLESISIANQMNDIAEQNVVSEVSDDANTEIIKQTEEIEESNPYWDYIKMNLINVDFSDLLSQNQDTVGWIQVNGTNINYPFVQANDNSFYLTHSFDKSYNQAGWVFMDYRNSSDGDNKNTILYAHGRVDQVMFGTLKNILTNGWLNQTDNYIIKLSTPYENTLWQIFSVYYLPTTNDYIATDFTSNLQFENFAKKLTDRSMYDFGTTVSGEDQILTLSTCYSSTEKLAVHAKLIKRSSR